MTRFWQNQWLFFVVVAAIGVSVDLWTKELADRHLQEGIAKPVLGPYLQFVLVYNKAAVFGLDPRKLIPGLPLNTLFYFFNVVAMIILILYYRSLRPHDTLLRWALSLIMAGAVGNLWDRAVHPDRGVVDFIRIGINDRIYWFIFNFADAYVTIGVGMIFLAMALEKKEKRLQTSGEQAVEVDANGETSAAD